MDLASVVQDHLRFFCIDRDHGSAKYLADIVFLIPASRLHGNLPAVREASMVFVSIGRSEEAQERLEIMTTVPLAIPFPDGLGRVQAGDTVSKDNVVFLRVVGEGILLYVSRNEVLPADAAYRGISREESKISPQTRHFTRVLAPVFFGLQASIFSTRQPNW